MYCKTNKSYHHKSKKHNCACTRTAHYHMHMHTHFIPCVISPLAHTHTPFCWARGERKDNADTALSSVMAPQAPRLSGLLCAASLSLITGHDGLHQLIPTEEETNHLSVCLSASLSVRLILSSSLHRPCHIFVHVQVLSPFQI